MALAELEAALLADPEDAATFGVYIDALVAMGDPRGELAAIQQRRTVADTPELAHAEAAVLERFGEQLLGKRFVEARPKVRAGYVLGWSRGHLRSLVLREPYAAEPMTGHVLHELLALPVARFLRHVAIDPSAGFIGKLTSDAFQRQDRRGPDTVAALAASPRPTLRTISFGQRDIPWDTVDDPDNNRDAVSRAGEGLGDLESLWRAAPNLREILISGGSLVLGPMDLPELRGFELRQAYMARRTLEDLAAAKLPKLESLVLWLGETDYRETDYSIETLRLLCDPARFPALRHLGLVCCSATDDTVTMLSRSPILPQLVTLDLRGGTLSYPADISWAAFAHLREIDLRWNTLERAVRIPNALVDNQRPSGDNVRFNACQE